MSTELQLSQDNYVFSNAANFENAQRMATALSKSNLVPKEYQNNMPNCLIALEVANRVKASPLMVMQNLTIIYNRPSWSAQFVIASINTCGRFKPLRFDLKGADGADDRTCIAWTVERDVVIPADVRTLNDAKKANLSVLQSPPVSIGIAKKEGWYQKNGSKWQTMPELMLHYRAGTFFGRLYAPDVLMGMQTAEEAYDIGEIKDVTPSQTTPQTSSINDILNATSEPFDAQTGEVTPTDHLNASIDAAMQAQVATTETFPLADRVNSMVARIHMDNEQRGTAEHENITESDEFRALWSEVKASGNKGLVGIISSAMGVK